MSPNLARVIFILFIVAAIIYDNRKEPFRSKALFVPLIWFLLSGSKTASEWLGKTPPEGSNIDYTQGDPFNRAFLITIMVLAVVILFRRRYRFGSLFRDQPWLLALFLFMGISVLWSDFAMVSAKRWFRSIGDLLMALVVLTEADSFLALQKIIRRAGFILIPLSILFIKYFRDIGVAYSYHGATMWVGVTTHKNSLGQLSCVVALYFLWRVIYMDKKEPMDILFLLMSFWILKGSGSASSKTSFTVFITGALILIVLKKISEDPNRVNRFLLITVVLFLFVNFLMEFLQNQSLVAFMVTSSGRDMTLTGRTVLWSDLIRISMSNPLLGSGYGGFWLGDLGNDLWLRHTWEPEQAHNGYIDILVNLGFIGLILFTGLLVASYRRILENLKTDRNVGCFQLTFFTIVLLYNVTESSFTKPTSFLWLLFLMIVTGIPLMHPGKDGDYENV